MQDLIKPNRVALLTQKIKFQNFQIKIQTRVVSKDKGQIRSLGTAVPKISSRADDDGKKHLQSQLKRLCSMSMLQHLFIGKADSVKRH